MECIESVRRWVSFGSHYGGVRILSNVKKLLPCLYELGVLCSFRTSEKKMHMKRCEKCPYYKKFVRDMENEEQEFWDEVDRIRKYGESPYGRRHGRRE